MYPAFINMKEEDWTKAMGELELFLLRVSVTMSARYVSHMGWLSENTAKFVRFFREKRASDPEKLYLLWATSRERHPNPEDAKRFHAEWTEFLERERLAA